MATVTTARTYAFPLPKVRRRIIPVRIIRRGGVLRDASEYATLAEFVSADRQAQTIFEGAGGCASDSRDHRPARR